MDYGYLLVTFLGIFSAVYCKSKNCTDQEYWEPHKGCTSCSNVCRGSRFIFQCDFHCPNWGKSPGNIQNDKIKVKESSLIKNNGTETAGIKASTVVPSVILPIVTSLALAAIIYQLRKRRTKNACKGQEDDTEIPLDDINIDESSENDDTSETKQAVITIDKKENTEDLDGLLGDGADGLLGDGAVSKASSAQSVYVLSTEASGDANRVEPDYDSIGFCLQDESARRHAQLIMLGMDNTELSPFQEQNEAGPESERAASSSEEPHVRPELHRVSLHREPGGRQNQLYLQQESPAERLEETSAVQPSMVDTTQKYLINGPSSSEPYMTERRNILQQPWNPQRPLPNGVESYNHLNVNDILAGANYEHFDQTSTSDNNDPAAT